MKILCIEIYGECYRKCIEGNYCSKEIECADRIVYETGIYKVVVFVFSIY